MVLPRTTGGGRVMPAENQSSVNVSAGVTDLRAAVRVLNELLNELPFGPTRVAVTTTWDIVVRACTSAEDEIYGRR